MHNSLSHSLTRSTQQLRRPLLGLAMLTLLAALWAGLIRIGWAWPPLQPMLPMLHGPMMVSGFLGTLISLERAVGLNQRWAFSAPLLAGVGALLLIIGVHGWPAPLLSILASLLMVIILIQIVRLHPTLHSLTILGGGILWLIGNGLWLAGWPIPNIVLCWIGFLVLTIVGERLELSRILRLSPTAYSFFGIGLLLFVVGVILTLAVDQALDGRMYDAGVRLGGVGLLAQSLWLLRYDIAQRRIKAGGQARYIAICLLSGYVWLGISGLLAVVNGGWMAGPLYDAFLHSLFLGFVFSMIFAHALIIFPAVVGLPMQYTSRFYIHLVLLHATLALRIVGDLAYWQTGRLWGGLLNGVVLLLFLGNTVGSIQRSLVAKKS